MNVVPGWDPTQLQGDGRAEVSPLPELDLNLNLNILRGHNMFLIIKYQFNGLNDKNIL